MSGGGPRERAVCVHAHFYQPPRENPWTGEIDREPSAAPWPNWNERIADECYAPNAAAEVHGPGGELERRDNYASLSFNVGPTLMAWLEGARPELHAAIVAADEASAARHGGHGGAIAQAHDHLILPLANDRDRRTQVRWGLLDFEYRFGRTARGMWCPETAVDVPTLEALAAAGVGFTILAPHQARRVREPGGPWRPAGEGLDTGRPYRHVLPSGREIALVFYDGELARGVAFEGLLHDGVALAARLAGAARDGGAPRLAHYATDGESYGHHHRHGEMALARAFEAIEQMRGLEITNYAQWLARHPPVHEVRIAERTSWSCAHGVKRWAGGCDCGTGGAGWDYGWRAPLRAALDAFRDVLAGWYEVRAEPLLHDPWAARDDHAALWLADPGRRDDWWDRHLRPGADRAAAARWLDVQRCALRMFTSCGWFFDDPAGLETRQVLRYAGRALELAAGSEAADAVARGERAGDVSAEFAAVDSLLSGLSLVRSNREPSWTAAAELRRILREDRAGRVTRPAG